MSTLKNVRTKAIPAVGLVILFGATFIAFQNATVVVPPVNPTSYVMMSDTKFLKLASLMGLTEVLFSSLANAAGRAGGVTITQTTAEQGNGVGVYFIYISAAQTSRWEI